MITNEVQVTILQAYRTYLFRDTSAKVGYIILIRNRRLLPVRQIYVQHFKEELCLNVITLFTIIVVVLRDVPKTVIWVNQNGGTSSC